MEATDDGSYRGLKLQMNGQRRWKLQTTEATDEWTEAMEATDEWTEAMEATDNR